MSDRADASVVLLDWFGEAEKAIQDVEWKLEDRDDSTNRLYVTTSLAEADGVKTEQELVYRQRRFSIVDIDRDRDADKAVIEADEVQAELADLILVEFKPNSWTLEQAVTAALAGTQWTIGELQQARYGRAEFEDISVLDALKFLARHQDARLSFDSLRRRVSITPNAGTDHEIVFTYGRQLANIEKTESAPTTTVIYPTGAEGMTVASVNDGVPYVEDYGYYTAQGISLSEARDRFRKEDYWSDERYTVKENLLRDTQNRLAVEAYPQISYTLTAGATRTVEGSDDFDLTMLRLGDRVHVWDQEIDAKIRAEVTAVTTSSDASENELTLAYLPPSLGAGVEGTYFGDSGRPSDGPSGRAVRRSQPQPRPSMPILEAINDLGVAVIRWNGQDHNGSYETIPELFGEVQAVAAPVVDGVVPSPSGDTAFYGGATGRRGGGVMHVAFGRPGEYAVWFQMVGRDGQTRSEFSEPLTVEVPEFVDTAEIERQLEQDRARLAAAEAKAQEALDEAGQVRDEWAVEYPRLQQDIADAQAAVADAEARLGQAEQSINDSRAGLENLRDVRLPALELTLDGVESAVADYDQRIQAAQDGADQARDTAEDLRDNVLPPLQGELVDLTENRLPAVEGTLDQTRLGMENLRDVRLPDLQDTLNSGLADANEWREVGAISASSLRVGDWENLLSEDYIWELRDAGLSSPLWRDTAGGAAGWGTITNQGGIPILIRYTAPSSPSTSRIAFTAGGRGIPVRPGDEFFLSCHGWRSTLSPFGSLQLQVRYGDDQLGYVQRLTVGNFATNGIPDGISWRVPDNASIRRMQLEFTAHADAAGNAHFGDFVFRRKNTGNMLVDGAISARHIMAESIAGAVAQFLQISAEQIDTEGLAAYLATIIELDAGQITSGKINTSRLDAEEVAGAVANFLTLDALEINVEQLAGEIANIIEITAESIAAGAISTRHMAIADTDNLFPQQAIEDLAANGDNTAPWSRVRGNPNRWTTITGQGRGMRAIRINDGTASNVRTTVEYRPGSRLGVPLSAGDSLRLTFYGWAGGTGAAPVISLLMRGADGSFLGRADSVTVQSGWHEYALEVHSTDTDARYLIVEFDVPAGVAMSGHWQDFKLRHMTGGELIVDGAVRARHIIAEEIAAAVAEFLELHADQITAGQIDTSLLNVDDLAARIATVIELNASRITTGQLGAARINVADLYSNTAFINNLRAAVVTALQLTAERGFIGGALLEDDSITVAKLSVTEQMTAQLFQAMEARIGDLAFNTAAGMNIDAGRITTGSLTGRTVQTSNTWASTGGAVMRENGSQGNFVAVNDAGQTVARLGGARNELSNLTVNGIFQTRPGGTGGDAISIDRAAWLGGNGERPYLRFDATYNGYSANPGITTSPNEGMIIYGGDPANQIGTGAQFTMTPSRYTLSPGATGEIRFDGRVLSSTYAAVLGGHTGDRNVGTGGVNMFVNYLSPLPNGIRFVVANAEAPLISQGRIVSTTIANSTDSAGFDVLMRRVDNLDAGTTTARVRWVAVRGNT